MKRKLLYLFLWLSIWGVSVFLLRAEAEAPEVPLEQQPIEKIVEHFALQNGLDPKLALSVMKCESNGRQSTVGDGGRSVGVFQYQKETWERHSKEFGEKLDRNSPFDQARLATWAIANGKGNEWTAFVAIKKGGTYSFYSRQLQKHFTVKCSMIQ